MSRHKKTRQQKKRTDTRRQATPPSQEITTTPTFHYSGTGVISKRAVTSPSHQATIATNTYVVRDLRRTMLVTAAVILAEMVLYLLLSSHIIRLPFIQY